MIVKLKLFNNQLLDIFYCYGLGTFIIRLHELGFIFPRGKLTYVQTMCLHQPVILFPEKTNQRMEASAWPIIQLPLMLSYWPMTPATLWYVWSLYVHNAYITRRCMSQVGCVCVSVQWSCLCGYVG